MTVTRPVAGVGPVAGVLRDDPSEGISSTIAYKYDLVGASTAELGVLQAEAVALLRELIRIDTSNPPGHETPAARLLARYLEDNGVECELVSRDPARANLVARVPGRRSEAPSLMLLGHTDVVPAQPERWRRPPFAGELDDEGYVWGRGALDMKNEVATRAVATAVIARSGEPLDGDLVFVTVADEEDGTTGVGMSWLVHERPDMATAYVLNEGAGERLELADGRAVVTISVGEKAAAAVRITALGTPGHTSMPYDVVHAVPVLAQLIERLTRYRPRRRLLPATRALLEQLVGPIDEVDAALGQATALHPALKQLLEPLFSTTIAPTRLHGSDALNVLPGRASVDCDCRLLPGSTVDQLCEELELALGTDLPYELEVLDAPVGGTISSTDSALFHACADFLHATDPDAILLPTLCTGFTDSHYLRAAFGSVAYGFWPSFSTPYEVWSSTVHGHNERVHVDDLAHATAFQIAVCRALLKQTGP
ncbi:MAG: M20/M25/M40 family metallo-hydrolase [Solirubrobacterales bacterium]|nr:M20/M25/M40 family metallo-hydrolase [Solirubrobacterales bacterium]